MNVEYDCKADFLYITLKDTKILDTRMLGEDVYVDEIRTKTLLA